MGMFSVIHFLPTIPPGSHQPTHQDMPCQKSQKIYRHLWVIYWISIEDEWIHLFKKKNIEHAFEESNVLLLAWHPRLGQTQPGSSLWGVPLWARLCWDRHHPSAAPLEKWKRWTMRKPTLVMLEYSLQVVTSMVRKPGNLAVIPRTYHADPNRLWWYKVITVGRPIWWCWLIWLYLYPRVVSLLVTPAFAVVPRWMWTSKNQGNPSWPGKCKSSPLAPAWTLASSPANAACTSSGQLSSCAFCSCCSSSAKLGRSGMSPVASSTGTAPTATGTATDTATGTAGRAGTGAGGASAGSAKGSQSSMTLCRQKWAGAWQSFLENPWKNLRSVGCIDGYWNYKVMKVLRVPIQVELGSSLPLGPPSKCVLSQKMSTYPGSSWEGRAQTLLLRRPICEMNAFKLDKLCHVSWIYST